MGNLYRRKSSGNEEDPFFQPCCAGPNRFKTAKNAAHTPGSFSRPEFLNKGAEPQTVKQYVPYIAAVSLERGCDELHGDRAHVCSDVSVVPGNLQVDADAARFVSDRMPSVSESGGAVASANVSWHHHDASAGCENVEQYKLLEIGHAGACARGSWHLYGAPRRARPHVTVQSGDAGTSADVARHHHDASAGCETVEQYEMSEIGFAGAAARVARHLPDASSGVPGGSRLIVAARSRSGLGSFVRNSSLSSHHVDHLHTHGVCCAHGEHDLHDARTNSCLGSHAARNNSLGLHSACDNSGGHVNSVGCTYNSCGGVRGGTKPWSTSTRCQVGCPAVEKLASLQQAPGRMHVETWAGCNRNPSLLISQEVEILSGCADMVACLPPPFFSSVSPGPGREVRNGIGWSQLEKTARSGVWLFRGALRGTSAFFAFLALAGWVRKGSFLTAWAVPPFSLCSCSYLYGRGTAIGPQTGKRCWPLLERLWRAIAPLMKPWCAEGDVPSAANLNLYRGGSSHVGWHSDDEPLFGERGEAKLIVSVSFGTQALFKWKGKSCPSNGGRSCWLDHGDILVMDGQCQDEFRHCTDPGSDQERINITFRWVKQHVASCSFPRTGVACCLPTCARGFSFSDTREVGIGIFWVFLASSRCFVHLGGTCFCTLPPCVYKVWVSKMCPLLDTPCGRRSVGALSLLPLGSLLGNTENYHFSQLWFSGYLVF